ncbi:MAG: hypothetical protein HY425_03615 [Candidatus Levybacteria bacterium]|nr:hypothetical protein [Candidatus Levybacteria bacterium]
MFEIIPGILEKEWSEIERKINLVKPFARSVHVDIIDGKFAPNITFLDPAPFAKYSSEIFFELHMMVDNPIQYIKPFADAGFKRFIGHIEKMPDQAEFVAQGQLLGEVGLAIDGPTDLSAMKVSYQDLDCLLVMTIKAGASGQKFNPEYLKKVEMLRPFDSAQGRFLPIEIDGGINDQTIIQAKNAGANRFVSASFIFNAQNPQEQYNLLRNKLDKYRNAQA